MRADYSLWLRVALGLSLFVGTSSLSQSADVPALAGTWTWEWKDRGGNVHHHVLEVEGVGDELAAREVFDQLPPVPVQKLVQDGQSVKFSVVRGEHHADYKGEFTAPERIEGKVNVTEGGQSFEYPWKAEHRTKPKLPPQPKPAKPEE